MVSVWCFGDPEALVYAPDQDLYIFTGGVDISFSKHKARIPA